MRITIETQNEGRIQLESETLSETQTQQQVTQAAAIDGGGPSDVLLSSIAGAAGFTEGEVEEGEDIMSMEDTSAFH